jgi:NADH-quinone oxidoreductase subunit H
MKFSMFFIAEYANLVTASALMVTLFFGGWDIPFTLWDNNPPWSFLKTFLTLGAFATKLLFFIFLYMWIRWTLPRFRYDQLMSLGWKFMLPLALSYIIIVAAVTLGLDMAGIPRDWRFGLIMFGMNIGLLVLVFVLLDRGRLISPASARVRDEGIARLRARSASSTLVPESGD